MRTKDLGAIQLILTTLLLLLSPLGGAPVNDEAVSSRSARSLAEDQNEEQQLKNLKAIPGNVTAQKLESKTYSNINGRVEMHQTKEESLSDATSGAVVAKVAKEVSRTVESDHSAPKTVTKTEIDVPSEGIHQITVNKKTKASQRSSKFRPNTESTETAEDYYTPYDGGVQYTPTDMAEYIRRTGDDQGVALAIEELMREGLMPRNEAVAYLEEVKNVLEYMQDEYNNAQKYNPYNPAAQAPSSPRNNGGEHQERRPSLMPPGGGSQFTSSSRGTSQGSNAPSTTTPMSRLTPSGGKAAPNGMSRSRSRLYPSSDSTSGGSSSSSEETEEMSRGHGDRQSESEVDYRDLLERLRIADFLYKEYSLEEVIYQLAKEMFTQSIIKGNRDAEESLERFSTFLQEETSEGRISKELETKILDVVMAALMDAVGARPLSAELGTSDIRRESAKESIRRPELIKPAFNGKGIKYDPKNPKTEVDTKNSITKEQLTYDKTVQRKMLKGDTDKGSSGSRV